MVGRAAWGTMESHMGGVAQWLRMGAQVWQEQQRGALGHTCAARDMVREVPALWIRALL